jgi:molybdopterin-guanine dinucleotide biosynthesis protein A
VNSGFKAVDAVKPVGIILAGGLSRRMGGGDKGLAILGGRPMLARVIERLRPRVVALALNANGDPARFAAFGLPVIPDTIAHNPGPLAGILAGLEWAAREHPGAADIVTVPADAPFIPDDLVSALHEARDRAGARVAIAASLGRLHPIIGLWPVTLAVSLRRAIMEEGIRKALDFVDRQAPAVADFSAVPRDPFHNVNTAEDFRQASRYIADE